MNSFVPADAFATKAKSRKISMNRIFCLYAAILFNFICLQLIVYKFVLSRRRPVSTISGGINRAFKQQTFSTFFSVSGGNMKFAIAACFVGKRRFFYIRKFDACLNIIFTHTG